MTDGSVTALRRLLPPDFALFIVPALPRHVGTGKVDRRALAELVGASAPPYYAAQEHQLSDTELESLGKWFRLFYPLGAAAILHALASVGVGGAAAPAWQAAAEI